MKIVLFETASAAAQYGLLTSQGVAPSTTCSMATRLKTVCST